MRSGVVAHEFDVGADNVNVLGDLDFVFVAVDDNETRQWLLPTLDGMGVPFVDVGMGIEKTDDKLLGVVRTSFCETPKSSAVRRGEGGLRDVGEYERNVQIVGTERAERGPRSNPVEEAPGVLHGPWQRGQEHLHDRRKSHEQQDAGAGGR